jgi:glycosyltransferase involved in cell wall biosynthesis
MARRLVVHLISDAGPHPFFRTIVENYDSERFRLMIGCVGGAGALQREMAELGIETFSLDATRRWQFPLALGRLVRMLRARRADVLHAHLLDGGLVGLAAARLARTPAAVITAHHSHELPFHGVKLRAVDRICSAWLADRVIAPSETVAAVLAEHAGVGRSKLNVIPHGFPLETLDPGRVSGEAVRAEFGLQGAIVFCAIGRNFWIKNYSSLIEAFAPIARQCPEARLLIVVRDGPTGELVELADRLEIANRVVLTGGRSDIADVLAAADVFVHPALAETFGMVIIEAMAMARPIVCTPVGIAPAVVEDGVTGVLCAGSTPQDLEASLRTMLEQRSRWSAMGQAARERAMRFSGRAMVASYEASYLELLGAVGRAEDPGVTRASATRFEEQ